MYLPAGIWVCTVLGSAMSYVLKSAHTGRDWLKKTLRKSTCDGLAEYLLVHHELVAVTLLYIEEAEHSNDHSPSQLVGCLSLLCCQDTGKPCEGKRFAKDMVYVN